MRRKFLAILLICAALCTAVAVASAGNFVKIGRLTYEIEPASGYAAVYSCDIKAIEVDIASHVQGYPVDRIQASAFAGCDRLQYVYFPDTLEIIASGAFRGCRSLTEIEFPENLKVIFSHAFQDCIALKKVTLPSKFAVIGDFAFDGCTALTSVKLPKSITYMFPDALPVWTAAVCSQGSYAESWAIENNHDHRYSGVVVATGIQLEPAKKALTITADSVPSLQLYADIYPSEVAGTAVSWKSSDKSVAIVNKSGTVTPVAPGKAVITCTAEDGGGAYGTCDITVKVAVVKSFRVVKDGENEDLANTTFSMKEGSRLQLLVVDMDPWNAFDPGVTWKSSDKSVVKITSEGVLKALAPGKAVITVRSNDGNFELQFTVKVK